MSYKTVHILRVGGSSPHEEPAEARKLLCCGARLTAMPALIYYKDSVWIFYPIPAIVGHHTTFSGHWTWSNSYYLLNFFLLSSAG